jgi:hypothetical protein
MATGSSALAPANFGAQMIYGLPSSEALAGMGKPIAVAAPKKASAKAPVTQSHYFTFCSTCRHIVLPS